MPEEIFYNALNVFLESDYHALADLKLRSETWETAWRNYSVRSKDPPDPESEWRKVVSSGTRLVLFGSDKYPQLLKEIPQPPHGLYVVGDEKDEKIFEIRSGIAVVGTRKGTPEGKEFARHFAAELSRAGFTIISGLALGIDAAAHAGCLESGGPGKTIAVLACGLDRFYPSTNEKLAKKIAEEGGAIISEYPPGSPPYPSRFLERNRVVSGLSRGVLVIEAPENSGSLVTARYALDQNRDIFVVPGTISHPNYKGSNQLIRQGAELVTKPEEILEAYGCENKNKSASEERLLSTEEIHILSALRSVLRPLEVDKIIEMTTLEPQVVNRLLSLLVIKNFIRENGNGYTMN